MPEQPGPSPEEAVGRSEAADAAGGGGPPGHPGTSVGLPGLDALTATVALQVTGGSGGDRVVVGRWVDGRPVEPPDADGAAADVTFVLPEPEAAEIVAGLLSPSVAYMQGRLKTSGDPGLVLDVLAATATPELGRWLGRFGSRG